MANAWLVLGTLVILGLPKALAFTRFSHTLSFPSVSYEKGLLHIHSPEHAVATHGVCLPEFKVLNSSAPRKCQNVDSVWFDCSVGGGRPLAVHMYTDTREVSNLLVFRADLPVLRMTLSVSPRPGFQGHNLHVEATALHTRPRRWMVVPMVAAVAYLEDRTRWAPQFPEDPNLRLYRRSVLFREA